MLVWNMRIFLVKTYFPIPNSVLGGAGGDFIEFRRIFKSLNTYPHCKNTIPNIRNKYFQKRNCASSVPNSAFMCLWAIYIFPQLVCLFCCRKICGPILGIAHRHEYRNWDWGRAIPFLGIHKWDFRCSAAKINLAIFVPRDSPFNNLSCWQDARGYDGRAVLVRLHLLQQPVQGRRPEVHRADWRHQAHRQEVRTITIFSFLKGTVSRDWFSTSVFFMNQFPPSLWVYH